MLTTTVTVAASRRTEMGKGAARQLRAAGKVPAVVYGRGRQTEELTLDLAELELAITGVSQSTIISLTVDGDTKNAVIRDVQKHPFRPGILHVDFLEVTEGQTLTVDVPIHLEGIPEGVRNAGGFLDQVMRELTIEVLPRDMKNRIDVDVTHLGIGNSLHVSDLVIENATVLTDPEMTVCSVIPPKAEPTVEEEEAEIEEVEEGAEPELIRKPKEDEAEE